MIQCEITNLHLSLYVDCRLRSRMAFLSHLSDDPYASVTKCGIFLNLARDMQRYFMHCFRPLVFCLNVFSTTFGVIEDCKSVMVLVLIQSTWVCIYTMSYIAKKQKKYGIS